MAKALYKLQVPALKARALRAGVPFDRVNACSDEPDNAESKRTLIGAITVSGCPTQPPLQFPQPRIWPDLTGSTTHPVPTRWYSG
eukprot:SAG11_NODE_10073_length_858_cov_1.089592_2_plen_84_part_01